MAKDNAQDRVKQETLRVHGKIADSYEKLATRFRERSQNADEKAQAAEKKGRQEVLRRRSELYAQAAKELKDKAGMLDGSAS